MQKKKDSSFASPDRRGISFDDRAKNEKAVQLLIWIENVQSRARILMNGFFGFSMLAHGLSGESFTSPFVRFSLLLMVISAVVLPLVFCVG